MKYIIIGGSPTEGFTYHGPFDSEEAAWDWARDGVLPQWWIAEIQAAP